MLFPSEDQSKLDKRSLINLPISLGWGQIGSCSHWLSQRAADVTLTGGVALGKTTPPVRCRAQTRTQVSLGHPCQVLPYILHLVPPALCGKKKNISLGKQTGPSGPREAGGESCKGYAHSLPVPFLISCLEC